MLYSHIYIFKTAAATASVLALIPVATAALSALAAAMASLQINCKLRIVHLHPLESPTHVLPQQGILMVSVLAAVPSGLLKYVSLNYKLHILCFHLLETPTCALPREDMPVLTLSAASLASAAI
jgi:hypothetical protein